MSNFSYYKKIYKLFMASILNMNIILSKKHRLKADTMGHPVIRKNDIIIKKLPQKTRSSKGSL